MEIHSPRARKQERSSCNKIIESKATSDVVESHHSFGVEYKVSAI
ncbi:hypothetical protein [uncultured Helicobacter sp.]